jgi:hypothetical protein
VGVGDETGAGEASGTGEANGVTVGLTIGRGVIVGRCSAVASSEVLHAVINVAIKTTAASFVHRMKTVSNMVVSVNRVGVIITKTAPLSNR